MGLCLTLLMTTGVWLVVRRVEHSRLQALKQTQAFALAQQVERRMGNLEQALRGASGYLGRGSLPTRSEWHAYVERLDLPTAFPGVQGFSFVEWIPRTDLPAHVRRIRQEGFPDYAVVPGGSEGPLAEGASAILYLEPTNAENQHAFGKDMLEDATRRQAMLQARDTGQVVTSGPLVLYQEAMGQAQPGVVLYGPVYREGQPTATVADRRGALRGWVTIPLRLSDFIHATLPQFQRQVELRLHDDPRHGTGKQLYDSDPVHPVSSAASAWTLNIPGRTWVARIEPGPEFFRYVGHPRHWQLLFAGAVIGLLVFTLLIIQTGAEGRAQLLARLRGEELLASDAQFRALFEKAPSGMAIVDSGSGRFLSVNAHLADMLGYSAAELLAKDFQSITHPEHLAADLASVRELASGSVPVIHKEKRYLHRDGHEVWARLSMVKLPVTAGAPARHLSMVEDITEARRRQQEIHDSEARFHALFDLLPLGVTVTDDRGRIVASNRTSEALLGIPADDLVRREFQGPYWDILRSDGSAMPPQEYASVRAMREQRRVQDVEMGVRRPDGQVTWLLVTSEPIPVAGYGVLIVYRDVSAHRLAQQQLVTSEARWQFALDGAGDGVWDWSAGSECMFVSRGYKVMLGFGADEDLQLTYADWVERIHPEDRDAVLAMADAYMQGRIAAYQAEYRLRRKDGGFICVLARGMAVTRDEQGRPTRMIGTHADITLRKQAEAALRRSESDLASAQEIGDFGSWRVVFDGGGEAWSVSEGLRRLYGFGPDQPVTMQTGLDMMHPEDRACAQAAWDAARDGIGPCEWEHRILVGGETRWMAVRVQFQFSADGQLQEASGINQDITRRKATEEALRNSEARLRILGDQLPDSFLYQYLSRPGEAPRFIYLSAGVERLCGVSPEAVLGDAMVLLGQMDPAMLPAYFEAEAISARDITPFAMDLRQRHTDGGWRWFRVRSMPRPQPDGSVLWEGISTDITDAHEARLLLEESEARFRGLSESAPVFIWVTDAEQRTTHINQAWAEWTGLAPGPDLDRSWMESIHPEDLTRCREALGVAFETRLPFATEFRMRHRSGFYRWISDRGTPRFAPDGTFLGYIGAGIDIQDLKDAEAEVRSSDLRAQKAESLVLMAGSIAHDFNNIFQGVLGSLEVAAFRAGENPDLLEVLGRAEVSLRKAIGLSWKMLDFSGRALVRQERLDLERWLSAFVAILQMDLPPGFQLECACGPVPTIAGDRIRLEEVLQALVTNAREAAGSSTGRIRLKLYTDFGADRPGSASPGTWPLPRPEVPATVCLECSDDGPGVAPALLDRICDPFFTTREMGRGLGLASVTGILQAHHAGLHIFNGEHGGLVLRMHFPPSGA
ncbi:MAG: PAS domain S-box protein [Holophagaceae bacterium]|uniref:histidine kinase n=1 Tax=Candidatus Geothrix skivensis TaxID=2954439 RepID=A0A9D7XGT5_9BACT|nr:PAS domain S-box protein [Candidatus Geothrix skivensis]